ncbi:MAG: hypothetical protein JOZ86_15830 [Candidatus Eremiobacteraeota bacterium]|nr:hypothetical protein [Candidatus Eremiobacteraeota bacterium]
MTSTYAEALWRRALLAVAARGLVPTKAAALTPAELARAARDAGDDRLVQLVEGFYYPARYGDTAGALSDDDALRLVVALESDAPQVKRRFVNLRFAEATPPSAADATLCDVCGKRPRATAEPDG